jgi:hypothetical protein
VATIASAAARNAGAQQYVHREREISPARETPLIGISRILISPLFPLARGADKLVFMHCKRLPPSCKTMAPQDGEKLRETA